MRLKAIDTLHVSSVKADSILPGEEFDAADDTGRQLVERALAVEVKAAPDHSNKMQPAPANKAGKTRKDK